MRAVGRGNPFGTISARPHPLVPRGTSRYVIVRITSDGSSPVIVEVLPSAVRLTRGVLLDALRAGLQLGERASVIVVMHTRR